MKTLGFILIIGTFAAMLIGFVISVFDLMKTIEDFEEENNEF